MFLSGTLLASDDDAVAANADVLDVDALTVRALPGATLWSGESLTLECRVRRPSAPRAFAVWHRTLLDPAGRNRCVSVRVDPTYYVRIIRRVELGQSDHT